jgi:hypothetical protein
MCRVLSFPEGAFIYGGSGRKWEVPRGPCEDALGGWLKATGFVNAALGLKWEDFHMRWGWASPCAPRLLPFGAAEDIHVRFPGIPQRVYGLAIKNEALMGRPFPE